MSGYPTSANHQLLNDYGYIFTHGNTVGVLRPEVEGFPAALEPVWQMPTVGGLRDMTKTLSVRTGPNADGFVGRPQTEIEVADAFLREQLGLRIIGRPEMYTHFPQWYAMTRPFNVDKAIPNVRRICTVFRIVYAVTSRQIDMMHATLLKRNATVGSAARLELDFVTIPHLLNMPHAMTDIETAFLEFYLASLLTRELFPMVDLHPLMQFE